MAPAKRAAKKTAKKAATKKTAAKKTAKKTAKKAAAKKTAKRTAKKAAKRTSGSNSAPTLVVSSRVKELARSHDVRVANEFTEAFNAEVATLLERAVRRAEANGRRTLRPGDL